MTLCFLITSASAGAQVIGYQVGYQLGAIEPESVPLMSPLGLAAQGAIIVLAAARVLRNRRK